MKLMLKNEEGKHKRNVKLGFRLLFCFRLADEREKLFEEIEKEWSNHLKNPNDDDIFDDVDECIVKVSVRTSELRY